MHSQRPNRIVCIRRPHCGAAVADQGASVACQGHAVADQEPTFAGQVPAVADQEPYLESTEQGPQLRNLVEIRDERARLERIVRITPLTVPFEADCATLEESLAELQRIRNALDRTMQQQTCVQASLQLDAGEGRVGRTEYSRRFAGASDKAASAGEAIRLVREIFPLLRYAIGPEGR